MIKLELPYPPSVNHYWGQSGKNKFLGKKGKEFRIAVAEADIVQVLTITSSPGSRPRAPTAAIKPEVQEFTEIACFTLKNSANSASIA